MFAYFEELKTPMVYRKFDNNKFNTIPLNNLRYFAGFFFNIKKLIADYKGEAITSQSGLVDYFRSTQLNNKSNINLKDFNEANKQKT